MDVRHLLSTRWLVLVAVSAATAAAQTTPADVFGTWTLESRDPSDANAPDEMVIVDVRSGGTAAGARGIRVIRRLGNTESNTLYEAGVDSGTVGGSNGDAFEVPQTHRTIKWTGTSLVIDEGQHVGPVPRKGDWRERQERWVPEGSDALRVSITTEGSQERRRTTVLIYARATPQR